MDRLPRAALISRLVQELIDHGSWTGETHVQKAAYLLQSMLAVPLGYQFVLYRYGPFSFDLRDELTAMRGDDIIQLVPKEPPYGPQYCVTKQAGYIQSLFPKTLSKSEDKIQYIASKLGASGVASLERLATAFYVISKLPDASTDEQTDELVRLKPHISPAEALKALHDIEAIQAEAKTEFRLN
jgi:uncharacterized protein YwgA